MRLIESGEVSSGLWGISKDFEEVLDGNFAVKYLK
jgi:hypothetical protein